MLRGGEQVDQLLHGLDPVLPELGGGLSDAGGGLPFQGESARAICRPGCPHGTVYTPYWQYVENKKSVYCVSSIY